MNNFMLCKKLGVQTWTRPLCAKPHNAELSFPAVDAGDLENILSKSIIVTGFEMGNLGWVWGGSQNEDDIKNDTHTARLILIEPIEKKKCEHKPRHIMIYSYGIDAQESICDKCGVKLKATWSEAK